MYVSFSYTECVELNWKCQLQKTRPGTS